jgi:hypothetical protein
MNETSNIFRNNIIRVKINEVVILQLSYVF